ncbi:M20/M25/M40 family metallo-hydrolase [uncultured Parasphingopyxis sp.]|uniref:M20/M25/M40 family metallo-hydrolase n=1 Tax=uncultured Parasphingopyxis sp. TaxID=1547918 RepID=UPI0026316E37|nr:M20/M25/M40 family metallo-hydrolase [uncultured Parasphingopyxis sp.]
MKPLFYTMVAVSLFSVPAIAQDRAAERALLEQVVEIPTVAGRGEMPRLVELLRGELGEAGFDEFHVQPHDETQTLIARRNADRPSGEDAILLMAHMDVVDANPADWQNPPFEFREEEGYYLGRGIADNKSGLVGMILALQRIEAAGVPLDRDIVVLFTGDEETAQEGARLAASEWRDLLGDVDMALNSDGGGGTVFRNGEVEAFYMQVAEKTYADFTFRATNRGGHSSAPRPDNAIYQLAGALKNLEEHRFPQQLNDATRAAFTAVAENDGGGFGQIIQAWLADPENDELADQVEAMGPGQTRTRCVATQLSGGHAPNALPQSAEANVNCRIFPGTSIEEIRQTLQDIAGQFIEVEIVDGNSPGSDATPVDEELVAAYRRAIGTHFADAPIVPFMSAGATDGLFIRNAGIRTYGVGGLWSVVGVPTGAHGLDERVLADGFHGSVDIWEALLRDVAGAD